MASPSEPDPSASHQVGMVNAVAQDKEERERVDKYRVTSSSRCYHTSIQLSWISMPRYIAQRTNFALLKWMQEEEGEERGGVARNTKGGD